MPSTPKPREEWTRQEVVAFHLRTLALHLDPRSGTLKKLADAIEVDKVTLGRWKAQGYVPEHQVRKLQRRFGKKLVSMDVLCPPDKRRCR